MARYRHVCVHCHGGLRLRDAAWWCDLHKRLLPGDVVVIDLDENEESDEAIGWSAGRKPTTGGTSGG